MRFFIFLFLVGCSQTTSQRDAAANKQGLACSDAVNGCACVLSTPPSGSCSPTTIGTAAHCCAHQTNGTTDRCYCAKDGVCFVTGGTCFCNAGPIPDGGTVPDAAAGTCPKSMNGHCCKKNTDASQGECRCIGGTCAMDETEVMSCTSMEGNLQCGTGTMSVASCQ